MDLFHLWKSAQDLFGTSEPLLVDPHRYLDMSIVAGKVYSVTREPKHLRVQRQRAVELLGPRYLLHRDNQVKRKQLGEGIPSSLLTGGLPWTNVDSKE